MLPASFSYQPPKFILKVENKISRTKDKFMVGGLNG
jgi:hypothetical protein